ncbi:MAG: VOC family protein [Rhodobacteraceae bacterium]|nr:VOC family protein [Paracoccaceae bacterium]
MTSAALHAGFDHAGFYAEDLAGARARFVALGFTVTPPARFAEQAFATSAIMTGDTYISISGVLDWDDVPGWMREGMGKGLQAFVLRSHDLDRLYAEKGPAGTPELSFEGAVGTIGRTVRIGDRDEAVRFKVLRLKRGSLPGLARCNFCQHLTAATMWHPSLLGHRNGTSALRTVTAVHDDPAAARDFHARLFGRAVLDAAGDLVVDCGRAVLRLVRPRRLAELWPAGFAPARDGASPLLAGLTLATRDIAAARACLLAAGVATAATAGGGIAVAARDAAGAVIEFVPDNRGGIGAPPPTDGE